MEKSWKIIVEKEWSPWSSLTVFGELDSVQLCYASSVNSQTVQWSQNRSCCLSRPDIIKATHLALLFHVYVVL